MHKNCIYLKLSIATRNLLHIVSVLQRRMGTLGSVCILPSVPISVCVCWTVRYLYWVLQLIHVMDFKQEQVQCFLAEAFTFRMAARHCHPPNSRQMLHEFLGASMLLFGNKKKQLLQLKYLTLFAIAVFIISYELLLQKPRGLVVLGLINEQTSEV